MTPHPDPDVLVELDDATAWELERWSALSGLTRASVIRRALREWLEANPAEGVRDA